MEDGPKAGIRTAPGGSARIACRFPMARRLEILHAPDPLAENALADERVAVFRLHWRGWKLLFTSDAGMGTELKLLDAGKDVAADVIIAGRHRGDLTLCDRFLDAVNPQAIIASNSPFPLEERLAPDTVDYWKSRGIQVIDQGAVRRRHRAGGRCGKPAGRGIPERIAAGAQTALRGLRQRSRHIDLPSLSQSCWKSVFG